MERSSKLVHQDKDRSSPEKIPLARNYRCDVLEACHAGDINISLKTFSGIRHRLESPRALEPVPRRAKAELSVYPG
jgi:hypothetical protein